MERTENLPLVDFGFKKEVLFNAEKINSLSEITKREPFLSEKKIVTIFDLDGVIFEPGKKNNYEDNFSRLLAFRDIISKSSGVMYNSFRINIDENGDLWNVLKPVFGRKSVSRCPFMIENSKNRLKSFTEKANPDIEIKFNISFEKIKGLFKPDNKILSWSEKVLEHNKSLVFIGSSFIDLIITEQVAKNAKEKGLNNENIYSFNTGHRWI